MAENSTGHSLKLGGKSDGAAECGEHEYRSVEPGCSHANPSPAIYYLPPRLVMRFTVIKIESSAQSRCLKTVGPSPCPPPPTLLFYYTWNS